VSPCWVSHVGCYITNTVQELVRWFTTLLITACPACPAEIVRVRITDANTSNPRWDPPAEFFAPGSILSGQTA
jgi:hypothetical protein